MFMENDNETCVQGERMEARLVFRIQLNEGGGGRGVSNVHVVVSEVVYVNNISNAQRFAVRKRIRKININIH